ncbi:hypothetical protein FRB95_013070 [Tulasnella sp. JGI-2019a]|nr:hypothetical protein FRB95_013070 [Tulasnella sp. JGI-2019a]
MRSTPLALQMMKLYCGMMYHWMNTFQQVTIWMMMRMGLLKQMMLMAKMDGRLLPMQLVAYTTQHESMQGKYHTSHDHANHIARQEVRWNEQLDDLTITYLAWKHGQGEEPSIKGLDPDSMPPIQDPGQETDYFEVNTVSMHWHQPNLQIPYQGDTYLNTTLICHGLLSSAPVSPSMAVSLHTLEAHHLYHLVHPSLSIQLLTKVLCLSHQQPYHPHLCHGLSDAFDIYLSILQLVDSKVQLALLHNMPDWQLMHACLPCMYKLEEEDQLDYSLLFAIDSGSSLKWFADSSLVPSRKKTTRKKRKRGEDTRNDDDDADAEMEMKGGLGPTAVDTLSIDATLLTLEGIILGCMERWKANAPDEKKGMFSCYDESGIFISVCQHGHILVVADMVQSGELAKYPLAILAKLQAIFPGSKLGAYDIGCAAAGTVERSSIRLSMNLHFVIPAMHGYAHNRACQLNHHPNYTAGTGLEDFEMCKRTFASSNGCA